MKTKVTIGIVISVAALYWAFRDVQFAEFIETFKTANYFYFLLTAVFAMAVYALRALRWQYLLILQKDIPFQHVFSATCIGFFANNVLPFRAGEFLRAYVLGKNENISSSAVFATIFVERIIDVLTLLFIAVIALLFFPLPDNPAFEAIKYFGLILLLVEFAIIIFCILLVTLRDATLRITDRLLSIMPDKIQSAGKSIIDSFLEGLEIIKAAQHYFVITVSSFAIWLVACAQIFLMMYAFNADLGLGTSAVASVVVMVLISFALTIPAAPGFVGTFHAAAIQGLVIFSVSPNVASGFAFSLHLVSYIPITLTGFYYFMKENIKLSTSRSDLQEQPKAS